MGTYDTFTDEDEQVSVQVKCGPCTMDDYKVGDDVGRYYRDGAIIGPEGCVIIKNGHVKSVTKDLPPDVKEGKLFCQNKWGGAFDPARETPETLAEDLRKQFQSWTVSTNLGEAD
jgi:hypothetical protein